MYRDSEKAMETTTTQIPRLVRNICQGVPTSERFPDRRLHASRHHAASRQSGPFLRRLNYGTVENWNEL